MLDIHISEQIEPKSPHSMSIPVLIDKVSTDKYIDGDEYNYWIN